MTVETRKLTDILSKDTVVNFCNISWLHTLETKNLQYVTDFTSRLLEQKLKKL
jgi:hypothetical protein